MPSSFSESIAREIRAELGRQRVTRRELAKRVGILPSGISRRLNGEIEFRMDEVAAVAGALGVPVSRFVGGDVTASAA